MTAGRLRVKTVYSLSYRAFFSLLSVAVLLTLTGTAPDVARCEDQSGNLVPLGEVWQEYRKQDDSGGFKQSLEFLARMHMRKQQWSEASQTWGKWLDEFPDDPGTGEVLFQFAISREGEDNVEQAIQLLSRVLKQYPESDRVPDAMLRMARLISQRVVNWEDVENIYEDILADFSLYAPYPPVVTYVNARCNQEFMDCDHALGILDDLAGQFGDTVSGARALVQAGIILEYNLSDPTRARQRWSRVYAISEPGEYADRARILLALHYLFFESQGDPRARRKGLVPSAPQVAFAPVFKEPHQKSVDQAESLLAEVAPSTNVAPATNVATATIVAPATNVATDTLRPFALFLNGFARHFFLRDIQAAISSYNALAAGYPDSRWTGYALFNKAQLQEFEVKDPGAACESFKTLITYSERNQNAYRRCRQFLLDASSGVQRLEKNKPVSDQPHYLYSTASWFYSGGKFREATRRFTSLAERFPESGLAPAALYEAANVYLYELESPDESYAVLRKVYSEYPDYEHAPEALYRIATVEEQGLNYTRALNLFQTLKSSYAGTMYAGRAALRMAEIHERLENLEQAVDCYREVLKLSNTDKHLAAAVRERLIRLYERIPGKEKESRKQREATVLSGSLSTQEALQDPVVALLGTVESYYLDGISAASTTSTATTAAVLNKLCDNAVDFFEKLARLEKLSSCLSAAIESTGDKAVTPVLLLWMGRVYSKLGLGAEAAGYYRRLVEEYTNAEIDGFAAAPRALEELASLELKRENARKTRILLNGLVETWPESNAAAAVAELLQALENLDRLHDIQKILTHHFKEGQPADEDLQEETGVPPDSRETPELLDELALLEEAARLCAGPLRLPGRAAGYYDRLASLSADIPQRADAVYRSAFLLLENDNGVEAQKAFSKFLREFPDDPRNVRATIEMGRLLATAGRKDDVSELLTDLISPDNPAIAFEAGTIVLSVLEESGTAEEQIDLLKTLISVIDRSSAGGVVMRSKLGHLLFDELGRPSEAHEALRVALSPTPEDPRILFLSARINADGLGTISSAREDLQRIIQLDVVEDYKSLARKELEALDAVEKIKKHQDFTRKYPSSSRLPEVLFNLAHLQGNVRGNFKKAEKLYREVTALFPKTSYAARARNELKIIRTKQIIWLLERALREGSFTKTVGFDEGIIESDSLTEAHFDPGELIHNQYALLQLGLLYESIGTAKTALSYYNKIAGLSSQPGNSGDGFECAWLSELAFLRRCVLEADFDVETALFNLGQVIRNEWAEASPYLISASIVLKKELEHKQFIRGSVQFAEENPDRVESYDLLNRSAYALIHQGDYALLEQGEYDDAVARLDTILNLYPQAPGAAAASLKMCRLKEEQGLYEETLKGYELHVKRYGDSPELLIKMSDLAYEQLDDTSAAVLLCRKTLELDITESERRDIEQRLAYLKSSATVVELESLAQKHSGEPSAPGFLMTAAGIKEKLFLYPQAVDTYCEVADRYPLSPHAPKALWQAALLKEEKLEDVMGARKLCQRITAQFPGHDLAALAEKKTVALGTVSEAAGAAETEDKPVTDLGSLKERLELDLEKTISGEATTMEAALLWPEITGQEKYWLHGQLADLYQEELQQYDKAVVHLRALLAVELKERNRRKLLDRLGKVLEEKLEDYQAAAETYHTFLDEFVADPSAARMCFHCGEIFEQKLSEYEKAREYYERVIDSFVDSEWVDDAMFRLAGNYETYYRDYESALDIYQDLIDKYIDSPWADDAQYRRGVIYEHYLREYENAIGEYEKLSLNYSNSAWERLAQEAILRLEGKF